MNVDEIRTLKRAMESEIKETLQTFMRLTGVTVMSVDQRLINITQIGDPYERHEFTVNVVVEI